MTKRQLIETLKSLSDDSIVWITSLGGDVVEISQVVASARQRYSVDCHGEPIEWWSTYCRHQHPQTTITREVLGIELK